MKKLTIEEVKQRAKELGNWIVLDDVYKGNCEKLKCRCTRCGYEHKITWSGIQAKSGCPKCNNGALTIEFVRSKFAEENYELLTKTYDNARQKLEYICSNPEKHRHSITWGDWKSGSRCPECATIEKAKKLRTDIEFIRSEFAKKGYILLTKIYKNNRQKLEYLCPRGHRYRMTWTKWQQGQECPFCNQLTIEKVKKLAAEAGVWLVLDKHYKNAISKLKCKCIRNGHYHMISWNHILRGTGCPKCNSINTSLFEKTVRKFLNLLHISYMPNDKSQLINPKTGYNLELDMWFPQLSKAIECNGTYWHSKERAIKNDKIKRQLCKEQDIGLLIVTEKEWNKDIDKCKTKIKNFVTGE